MDQTIVGVSHLKEVDVGDEVVVIGRQGNEFIPVEEVAIAAKSLADVIPVAFTARVPRVYVQS